MLSALGVSLGTFALSGVVTGLIPNPLYVRMVPRTGLGYLFLLLTVAFLGAYTYQRTAVTRGSDDATATAGAVGTDCLRSAVTAVTLASVASVVRRRTCRTCEK